MSEQTTHTFAPPLSLSRKRSLQLLYEQSQQRQQQPLTQIVAKKEQKDESLNALSTPTPAIATPKPSDAGVSNDNSVRAMTPVRATTLDMLDQAMTQSHQRQSTPQSTPRSNGMTQSASTTTTTVLSASERAEQRSAIDERKYYGDCYSQTQKWLALAHIAKNFIATAVNAETAVDLARSDETRSATQTK